VQSLFGGTLGSFCCIEAILLELDRELFWRAANLPRPRLYGRATSALNKH
jgi:hypothetical protein